MINFEEKQFLASDQFKITYYQTPQNERNRGMVLIVHGMAEHALRYHEFADFLAQQQFLVTAHDQRGHGKTGVDCQSLGFFAEKEGWDRVVQDIFELVKILKEKNPELPLFILGHSMGSLLTRTAIIRFPQLFKAAVIVGTTTGINQWMRKAGSLIAKHEIKKSGARTPSKKLSQLSFGNYNKKFAPNRTEYDWISLNPDNVDRYIADPLCGFTCSAGFYKDLFHGIDFCCNPKNIKKMPKNFPIFLIAGGDDPVGGNGKEVRLVYHWIRDSGMTRIELKLYAKRRHEILNETNRQEVYHDILNFLDVQL